MNAQTPPPQQAKPSPAQAAAMAAAARPTRLTGRAALLAVVICAIALSLAYPVREYIAQRQQIDQLLALQQTNAAEVQALEQENGKLTQTWYVEQQAEDELHMCFPQEQCYQVVSGAVEAAGREQAAGGGERLVRHAVAVRQARRRPARQVSPTEPGIANSDVGGGRRATRARSARAARRRPPLPVRASRRRGDRAQAA